MSKAVIATIGHDRPGLVSDITAIATSLALNIEDSRMTVLGGEFAVLMSLEGDDAALEDFNARMQTLCNSKDLAYLFRETQSREHTGATMPYRVSVEALDHPGIVHAIAKFFSERQINIRDLTTDTQPAAHTGTPIFNVSLVAEVAENADIAGLHKEFEGFCAEEDLDGTLTASD